MIMIMQEERFVVLRSSGGLLNGKRHTMYPIWKWPFTHNKRPISLDAMSATENLDPDSLPLINLGLETCSCGRANQPGLGLSSVMA